MIGLFAIVTIGAGVGWKQGWIGQNEKNNNTASEVKSASDVTIATEVVGEIVDGETDQLGTSWPGEIISAGDIEVQPGREGTIVELKVAIGQKVKQGQVLARLSAPQATPELTRSLADQAQSLARAKAQATATATFNQKNIEQLSTLRDALQKNLASTGTTLNGVGSSEKSNALSATRSSLEQARTVVNVKEQNANKIIEQILNRQILKFSNVYDIKFFQNGNLKRGLGQLDGNIHNNYINYVNKLRDELKNSNTLPVDTAQNYTQAAVKLLSASIAVDPTTQSELDALRDMANDDQTDFLTALKDYQEAKSEFASKNAEYRAKEVEYQTKETDYKLSQYGQEKEYAEKTKEINQRIDE